MSLLGWAVPESPGWDVCHWLTSYRAIPLGSQSVFDSLPLPPWVGARCKDVLPGGWEHGQK